jgi:transcriptional regulator with XRE-family HTH domain
MVKPRTGFPDWAVARRRELGLTQSDVAARINVTPTWVGQIERGGYRRGAWPSAYKVYRLCGALDFDVQEGLRIAGHDPIPPNDLTWHVWCTMRLADRGRETRKSRSGGISISRPRKDPDATPPQETP